MAIERKYYSINDISKITGLSLSKLRYAERIIPGFNIHKIRSRRYYTKKNLEQLKKAYGIHIEHIITSTPELSYNAENIVTAEQIHLSGDMAHSAIIEEITGSLILGSNQDIAPIDKSNLHMSSSKSIMDHSNILSRIDSLSSKLSGLSEYIARSYLH